MRKRSLLYALCLSCLAAFACDDSSSKTEMECHADADCASKDGGRTKCSAEGVCVVPVAKECSTDNDCAGKDGGRTKCSAEGACVVPVAKECSTDDDCAGKDGGRTKCNAEGACVVPDPICGDDKRNGNDACDGRDLDGKTCADFPDFVSGTLQCDNTCQFDKTSCDQCTKDDLSKCIPNTQKCVDGECTDICGDGTIDLGEDCDGDNLDNKTCADVDAKFLALDKLSCNSSCKFNTSACVECTDDDDSKCTAMGKVCKSGRCEDRDYVPECGNDKADDDEDCDGTDLGKFNSCADVDGKFLAGLGSLACHPKGDANECKYNTTACVECTDDDLTKCGDGQYCSNGKCTSPVCDGAALEKGEKCDGTFLGDATCASLGKGFVSGELACNATCDDYVTTGCAECDNDHPCADGTCENGVCKAASCGNHHKDNNEDCEDSELNGKTCAALGFPGGGNLSCDSNCHFKTTECVRCSEDAHCADEADGKNFCRDSQCKVECDNDTHCANKPDGRNFCRYNACTVECTSSADCKGNTASGKTYCDIANHVCALPPTLPLGDIVISQLYVGASSTSTTPAYNHKYLELFNRGDKDIDITGWSVQYSNKSGTVGSCSLRDGDKSFVIPAGKYFLIQLNGKNTGTALPDEDFSGCASMNPALEGMIILMDSDDAQYKMTAPDGYPTFDVTHYVDGIGYGSVNWAEGNKKAAKGEATKAAFRKDDGCTDTNNNGNDFGLLALDATHAPRNLSTTSHYCKSMPENSEERCSDGLDNDNNGTKDCEEDSCKTFDACQVPENTEEHCKDNLDNDNNGIKDCEEDSCKSFAFCNLEDTEAKCSDGLDNDNNGKKDCEEESCKTFDACQVPVELEDTEAKCSDDLDNDNNGKKDCEENSCKGFDACKDGLTEDTCRSDQEWSADYGQCVYPITSESVLGNYIKTWNASGREAFYPAEASGKKPVFLVKNKIEMSTLDNYFGTESIPFSGIFDGNKKAIVINYKKHLFMYLDGATVKNIIMHRDDIAEGYSLAYTINNSTLNNIEVVFSSSSPISYHFTYYYNSILAYMISNSKIDKMTINLNSIQTKRDSSYNYTEVSILANKIKDTDINDITLNGEVDVTSYQDYSSTYDASITVNALSKEISGESTVSRFTNRMIVDNQYKHETSGTVTFNMIADKIADEVHIDRIKLFSKIMNSNNKTNIIAYLLPKDSSTCTGCWIHNVETNPYATIAENIEDIIPNSNTPKLVFHLLDRANHLDIVNCLFRSWLSAIAGTLSNTTFNNVAFIESTKTGISIPNGTPTTYVNYYTPNSSYLKGSEMQSLTGDYLSWSGSVYYYNIYSTRDVISLNFDF